MSVARKETAELKETLVISDLVVLLVNPEKMDNPVHKVYKV